MLNITHYVFQYQYRPGAGKFKSAKAAKLAKIEAAKAKRAEAESSKK